MKIKDILGEDGNITVQGVTGDKAKLSNGQEIDAKTLTPDTQHPGQFTMPQMDPTAIKPGSVVTSGEQTEDMPNDPQRTIPPANGTNTIFVKQDPAPLIGTMMSDGDGLGVTSTGREIDPAYIQDPANSSNRVGYIKGKDGQMHLALNTGHQWKVGPQAYQAITGHSYRVTREGIEEGKHKDTIAQGGGDVGGDATDKFIDDVKDKEYERKNRNPGSGNRGPISGSKLKETDELYKWLTIAGIK